ncbi:MAG TPA: AbrB family transcriptional regulator [Solirubrobacteraceae bacterium]|nr:AbrB family transcriptional regulator [Solirubrobacteraceae bacterium]
MLGRWLALALATAAASVAVGALGLPSPTLFAALLVGLAHALAGAVTLSVEGRVATVSLALVGVAMGASFQLQSLTGLGGRWAGVALVCAATLAVSLAAGLVLAATTGLDRPTALLGLVAGGASGIIGMSDELHADARLVAFMQYARVLIVVLVAPLVAALFLGAGDGPAGAIAGGGEGLAADLAYTGGACAVGVGLGRAIPFPAAGVLLPMVVAAVLTGSGLAGDAGVPALVQDVAFAVIGLQVGLRFTPATVRMARRLLPAVVLSIAVMIVACAGLGWLLVVTADVTYADAYLATTPGGLYAVLATALDGGGEDPAFVLAVQTLRLFIMVLAAPLLVRLLVPPPRAPVAPVAGRCPP